MRPKRCAFGGPHGETNEILASLIGHTASWAVRCPRCKMFVMPNKKGSTAVSILLCKLFRSQAIRKTAALWLRPPKGGDQEEQLHSSLIKTFLRR